MATLSWKLTEPFNVAWEREYLVLDLPGGTTRTAVTDGTRVIPAQFDPARKALICCLDIAPRQELTLTPSSQPAPASGLRAESRPGIFRLRNAHCAVDLAAAVVVQDHGETWQVTGPLVSVTGPDGVPRGASRLVIAKSRFFPDDRAAIGRAQPDHAGADTTPPRVATKLTEVGEVFVRYQYRLTLADGRTYEFTAVLYADYPILFVEEETNLGRDGALEIAVSDNFPCDLYLFGAKDTRLRAVPLPPHADQLGSLAPHHTQGHTPHPWLGFMQSHRPQGAFRGINQDSLTPYADVLGFMAYRPAEWLYPGEITLQFECQADRRVTARGPVRRGRRAWNLLVLSGADVERDPGGDPPRPPSVFTRWYRRLNDIPFDWLRRLDLTSGALDPAELPRAVLSQAEFAAKRRGVFQELAPLLQEQLHRGGPAALYARWALTGDPAAARRLAEHVRAATERKLELFLCSGFLSESASAVTNRGLGPDAVYYEAGVAAGAFSAAEVDRLRTILLFFAHATAEDQLFPSHGNYLPPDHPRSIRNWALAEQYSDLFGTPNFQTDVYYNLGLFGAVFAGHPRARAWLEEAAAQFDEQLTAHFHPGGVYKEAINYFAHLLHNLLSLASVLKRHGVRDFYADSRFQQALGCLVDYLGAPRRATLERLTEGAKTADTGRQRFWPSIGDTGGNCLELRLQPLVAHAAWEVLTHNRALSDHLLAAWSACGRPLWGIYMPQFEFLYIQQLHPRCQPLRLQTRHFFNVGPMLRADVGRPSETSIFLRSGRATHHWGFDHGHFTVTTRGSQLIPDFGYHGTDAPGGKFVHGSGTWLHNIVTFGPHWNGDTGLERRGAERVLQLGADFSYIVCDLSLNNVRVGSWRNIQPIINVEYFRHFLFAANRYILVWDRIEHSVYASQLRINCLARAVSSTGRRLRFRGLDDVDLAVTVIAPERTEFHEGIVGPQRYVLLEQDCQRDYLWLCQPLGKGERAFTVASAPNLITVTGTDLHGVRFADQIFHAKGDGGATVTCGNQTRTLDGRFAVVRNGRTVLVDGAALREPRKSRNRS